MNKELSKAIMIKKFNFLETEALKTERTLINNVTTV